MEGEDGDLLRITVIGAYFIPLAIEDEPVGRVIAYLM
jgi:hypothetical protein